MSEVKHSPLPWHWTDHVSPVISIVAADGTTVVTPRYKDGGGAAVADFDLIVTAVNNYAELLATLMQLRGAMSRYDLDGLFGHDETVFAAFEAMDAAIAKATQGVRA